MTSSNCIQVAVPAPLFKLFDYLVVDPDLRDRCVAGCRVLVPFGNRKLVGIVINRQSSSTTDASKLKAIDTLIDDAPIVGDTLLQLLQWASMYYCHPIGECLHTALPSVARKKESLPDYPVIKWHRTSAPFSGRKNAHKQIRALELIEASPEGVWQDVLTTMGITPAFLEKLEQHGYLKKESRNLTETTPEISKGKPQHRLNTDQQAALERLAPAGRDNPFKVALLEGVTGSGKTEVYIAQVQSVLAHKQQALILVPEINLTPQTLKRFQSQLSTSVIAMHSGLSEKSRYLNWSLARKGIAKVIIGTRSAVFTPCQNLGLIIVDEEHDASYKQMDGFRYSARDLAVKRAQIEDCPIVLGSATPSLETLYNAKEEKYQWIKLPQRAGQGRYPEVSLIDIRSRPLTHGCSPPLLKAIDEHLSSGNQVIVFQNRRGYSPVLTCYDCGWISECQHCDARMTVHLVPPHLHCHHCDDKSDLPRLCPNCHSAQLHPLGSGTERLEHGLQQRFPEHRVLRVDRDAIRSPKDMEQLIEHVDRGEPCLLIGTQMLAKGHDFHHVTLVAIIDADAIFFSADFRAMERGAQQLIQVAGRTGRGEKPGKVLIQTRHPEHSIFQHVIRGDYPALANSLLEERSACELPPKSRLISIRAEAKQQALNHQALEQIKHLLYEHIQLDESIQIAGPLEAAIPRKSGAFHSFLHLFFSDISLRNKVLAFLPTALSLTKNHRVRLAVDVDPTEVQ